MVENQQNQVEQKFYEIIYGNLPSATKHPYCYAFLLSRPNVEGQQGRQDLLLIAAGANTKHIARNFRFDTFAEKFALSGKQTASKKSASIYAPIEKLFEPNLEMFNNSDEGKHLGSQVKGERKILKFNNIMTASYLQQNYDLPKAVFDKLVEISKIYVIEHAESLIQLPHILGKVDQVNLDVANPANVQENLPRAKPMVQRAVGLFPANVQLVPVQNNNNVNNNVLLNIENIYPIRFKEIEKITWAMTGPSKLRSQPLSRNDALTLVIHFAENSQHKSTEFKEVLAEYLMQCIDIATSEKVQNAVLEMPKELLEQIFTEVTDNMDHSGADPLQLGDQDRTALYVEQADLTEFIRTAAQDHPRYLESFKRLDEISHTIATLDAAHNSKVLNEANQKKAIEIQWQRRKDFSEQFKRSFEFNRLRDSINSVPKVKADSIVHIDVFPELKNTKPHLTISIEFNNETDAENFIPLVTNYVASRFDITEESINQLNERIRSSHKIEGNKVSLRLDLLNNAVSFYYQITQGRKDYKHSFLRPTDLGLECMPEFPVQQSLVPPQIQQRHPIKAPVLPRVIPPGIQPFLQLKNPAQPNRVIPPQKIIEMQQQMFFQAQKPKQPLQNLVRIPPGVMMMTPVPPVQINKPKPQSEGAVADGLEGELESVLGFFIDDLIEKFKDSDEKNDLDKLTSILKYFLDAKYTEGFIFGEIKKYLEKNPNFEKDKLEEYLMAMKKNVGVIYKCLNYNRFSKDELIRSGLKFTHHSEDTTAVSLGGDIILNASIKKLEDEKKQAKKARKEAEKQAKKAKKQAEQKANAENLPLNQESLQELLSAVKMFSSPTAHSNVASGEKFQQLVKTLERAVAQGNISNNENVNAHLADENSSDSPKEQPDKEKDQQKQKRPYQWLDGTHVKRSKNSDDDNSPNEDDSYTMELQ